MSLCNLGRQFVFWSSKRPAPFFLGVSCLPSSLGSKTQASGLAFLKLLLGPDSLPCYHTEKRDKLAKQIPTKLSTIPLFTETHFSMTALCLEVSDWKNKVWRLCEVSGQESLSYETLKICFRVLRWCFKVCIKVWEHIKNKDVFWGTWMQFVKV